jgi:hypothetical protein
MTSTDRQRWARVRPSLAWKRLGIPAQWVPVLPTSEDYTPGYVLLDIGRDRPRRAWAEHLDGLDIATNTWSRVASVPAPRHSLAGASMI